MHSYLAFGGQCSSLEPPRALDLTAERQIVSAREDIDRAKSALSQSPSLVNSSGAEAFLNAVDRKPIQLIVE